MFTLIRSMWALVMKRYIQNFKIKKRNQLVLRKNEVLVVMLVAHQNKTGISWRGFVRQASRLEHARLTELTRPVQI